MQATQAGDIRVMTDDQVRDAWLAGDITDDMAMAEMARRDRSDRDRKRRRILRAEYDRYLEWAWVTAEMDTSGYMVNHRGRDAGIDPRSLFSGPAKRLCYASEELLAWFGTNGRFTLQDFTRDAIANNAADRQAYEDWMATAEAMATEDETVAEAEAIVADAEVTDTVTTAGATTGLVENVPTMRDTDREGQDSEALEPHGRHAVRGPASARRAAADHREQSNAWGTGRPVGHVRPARSVGGRHRRTARVDQGRGTAGLPADRRTTVLSSDPDLPFSARWAIRLNRRTR